MEQNQCIQKWLKTWQVREIERPNPNSSYTYKIFPKEEKSRPRNTLTPPKVLRNSVFFYRTDLCDLPVIAPFENLNQLYDELKFSRSLDKRTSEKEHEIIKAAQNWQKMRKIVPTLQTYYKVERHPYRDLKSCSKRQNKHCSHISYVSKNGLVWCKWTLLEDLYGNYKTILYITTCMIL